MTDRLKYINLYDYYGELLTEKQKEYFEDYYFDNLTLAEIAENLEVSRNAVHKQLKETEKNINYEEYASILARLFVIDLFTMDNKINKYDVACLEYVYPDNLENFKTNVEDTIYKLMEDNTYGKRTEKLSIVNNVEITNEEESTFKINEEEVPSYVVTLNWDYENDLGYDKNATITLVKKDKKLYVVEYEGVVNE